MKNVNAGTQVEATLGAAEVVQHCGGLVSILKAAGLDLSAAHTAEGLPLLEETIPAAVSSVLFPLSRYEDVRATLGNQKRHCLMLVNPGEGPIPEATLAALR